MKAETSISTIVHLGAGLCRELKNFLTYNPEKILLVEADPERAEALKNNVVDSDNIEVYHTAVSQSAGKATLHRYNLADVNSLSKPTGLLELFPGLKELESLEVKTLPPSQLIASCDLDDNGDNWLIIDTPGEEMRILKELQKAGHLQLFKYLSLNCGRAPLYEGAVAGIKIVDWLQDEGFDLIATDDDEDPDRPCWTLKRNNLILRYKKLLQHFKNLQDESKQKKAKIDKYKKKIDELTRLCKKREDQLNEDLVKHDMHKAELGEKTKAIDDLEIDNKELTNQLHGKEQQIQELAQLRNEQASQIEKHLQVQDKQEAFLQEKINAIQELSEKNQELQDQIEKKEQRIHHLVKEHEEKLKQLNEKEVQVNKESTEKAELKALNNKYQQQLKQQNEELEKLRQQLETEKQKAQDHSLQLQEEQQYRQQLIDQEVLKVEAQLELIKDILIRDKAF